MEEFVHSLLFRNGVTGAVLSWLIVVDVVIAVSLFVFAFTQNH